MNGGATIRCGCSKRSAVKGDGIGEPDQGKVGGPTGFVAAGSGLVSELDRSGGGTTVGVGKRREKDEFGRGGSNASGSGGGPDKAFGCSMGGVFGEGLLTCSKFEVFEGREGGEHGGIFEQGGGCGSGSGSGPGIIYRWKVAKIKGETSGGQDVLAGGGCTRHRRLAGDGEPDVNLSGCEGCFKGTFQKI